MENPSLLLMECSKKLKQLEHKQFLLNAKQCLHLTSKSRLVTENIKTLVKQVHGKIELGSSMDDLYRVVNGIEALIQDCGRDDWVLASLWQMDNEEEFRELLEELNCIFNIVCEQFQLLGITTIDLQKSIEFNPINITGVKNDRKALVNRLLKHIASTHSLKESQDVAKYVYHRLVCQMDGEGVELNAAPIPTYHWNPQRSIRLGGGASGQVYSTNCFGLELAMKVFEEVDVDYEGVAHANFKKEVGILAGLSHPNIIKFVGCGEDNVNNKERYIVMEKMEKTLGVEDLLDSDTQQSYLIAIDIMLQIANGMFYLHDMNVAHRDLKPNNILVNSLNDPKLDSMGYVKVKLVDFGISKIEAKDDYEEPT